MLQISKIKNMFLSVLNIILIKSMFLQLHIKMPVIRIVIQIQLIRQIKIILIIVIIIIIRNIKIGNINKLYLSI